MRVSLVLLLFALVFLFAFSCANCEPIVERMTIPTLYSVNKQLQETTGKVDSLQTEFDTMKAQAAHATQTKNALDAIKHN